MRLRVRIACRRSDKQKPIAHSPNPNPGFIWDNSRRPTSTSGRGSRPGSGSSSPPVAYGHRMFACRLRPRDKPKPRHFARHLRTATFGSTLWSSKGACEGICVASPRMRGCIRRKRTRVASRCQGNHVPFPSRCALHKLEGKWTDPSLLRHPTAPSCRPARLNTSSTHFSTVATTTTGAGP